MKRVLKVIITIIVLTFLAYPSLWGEKIEYPETKKIKVVEKMHGVEIIDNYRWLEQIKDPQVQSWLLQQNNLSKKVLDNLAQRQWLSDRFSYYAQHHQRAMTRETIAGEHSFRLGKKKIAGKDNWVILIKEKKEAKENVLVNLNKISTHINAEMTGILPSPNVKYLLFTIETGGREDTSSRIMNLATKKILPDTLKGWRHISLVWLPDSSGFYYTACPRKGEVPRGEEFAWASVYFHKIGTTAEADKKVFYHPTEKYYYHVAKFTKCKKYILFDRYSLATKNNEIYFKKTGSHEPPRPLITGMDAVNNVTEFGEKFLLLTNLDTPLYKVYIIDIDKPGRENRQEFIPETGDQLKRITVSGDYIFANYMKNAATQIKIYDKKGRYLRDVPFPYIGRGYAWVKENEPGIKIGFSSFTFPNTQFGYDIKTGKLTFEKQTYPLKVDASPYITRQVWYPSKDGTKVSMFLLQRKDIKQNSENATLLYGYGGFGSSKTPWFNTDLFIWLEAGGMAAVANLRGGGEYGKQWYAAGRGINKQNTFDDCTAAAEWLIKNRYTNPGKLALYGSSNGGLTVAATAVQRPNLFKAVWSDVPILDMLRFHKSGPAKFWIREYGNPDDPAQFKYIHAYSPYHNVQDNTAYPAFLFTSGENDPRCNPFHVMKTAARLQAASSSHNPILLRVYKEAGHGSGILIDRKAVNMKVDGMVFLMSQLGLNPPGK